MVNERASRLPCKSSPARTLPSLQAVERLSQKHAERVVLYHQRACEANGCSMHVRATHLMAKRRRRSKLGHALLPRAVPVACCLARRIHDFAVLQRGCKQGPVCCLCINPLTCCVHNCTARKRRRVSDAESTRTQQPEYNPRGTETRQSRRLPSSSLLAIRERTARRGHRGRHRPKPSIR